MLWFLPWPMQLPSSNLHKYRASAFSITLLTYRGSNGTQMEPLKRNRINVITLVARQFPVKFERFSQILSFFLAYVGTAAKSSIMQLVEKFRRLYLGIYACFCPASCSMAPNGSLFPFYSLVQYFSHSLAPIHLIHGLL